MPLYFVRGNHDKEVEYTQRPEAHRALRDRPAQAGDLFIACCWPAWAACYRPGHSNILSGDVLNVLSIVPAFATGAYGAIGYFHQPCPRRITIWTCAGIVPSAG
jgi:hypothetical protein